MAGAVKPGPGNGAESVCDVIIVGAGFSGLYMLHKLRGLGFSVRAFEAGDGVGGTWYWNRYPGARVDVESQEYSYSFSEQLEMEWRWSERYAAQPELLRYLNHVADRFNLRPDIQFETRVVSAIFDESTKYWTVRTDRGDVISTQFCIMATGCLSVPKDVDIPGAKSFAGPTYHTGRWPKEGVDFTGKRVAVIGTGSSGIQSIPVIAREAAHVTVFQRTPNFSLPAQNGPLEPDVVRNWLDNREAKRQAQRRSWGGNVATGTSSKGALQVGDEERQQIYEECWAMGGFYLLGAFADLMVNKEANDTAAEFVRQKIRSLVKDPVVAEKLAPTTYPIGTKRACVDTGYYETYNRDNVSLVDLRETPIETLTPNGVRTSEQEFAVDCIVYAIGFDAMTGALNAIDIRGRGGRRLEDNWTKGPHAYLGLCVSGFPNLFLITGPGSPSVKSNMVVSIEQHVDWVVDCIGYLRERQISTIEAAEAAESDWVAHVDKVANATLFPQADSWYVGSNIAGKPRVFMAYIAGISVYRAKCDEIAANGYEGFILESEQVDLEGRGSHADVKSQSHR